MNYRSKAAALACIAVVGIGMTGCNNNSSGSTSGSTGGVTPEPIPPIVGTCTVPAAVTATATLDLNNTKIAVNTAIVTAQIGYMLSDGGMYYDSSSEKSAEKPKEVSRLASMVSAKVKTLEKNTALVKKSISSPGNSSLVYGDDIACDSGTYSAHYNDIGIDETVGNVDTGTYTEKFTLSFNECVLEQNDANANLIEFFSDSIMYSSALGGVRADVASEVYTYNGSLLLEFNSEYKSQDWSTPIANDHGNGYNETYEGNTHLITEALSMEYKEDGALRETYTSTEDLAATFNGSYDYNNTTAYDSSEAYSDGNYTRTYINTGTRNTSVAFKGSEMYQSFGESNQTTSMTACGYTVEITSNYENTNENAYTEYSQDSYKYTYVNDATIQSSGYLTMKYQSGEDVELFDVYGDGLKVDSSYSNSNGYNYDTQEYLNNYNSSLSMDGTVGSMLIGGSVVLDTQSPWLMSSEYPNSRSNEQMPAVAYGGYYFSETPYAGKTVVTGTNSAIVEFKYETEGEPYTYGVITVEGEEPVEYDSIEDMLGMNI